MGSNDIRELTDLEPILGAGRDELESLQFTRLASTLRHAYANNQNYRRKFDAAGVLRSAVITGVAAIALAHVDAAALQLDATARALLFAAAGLLAVAAFTAARARSAGRETEPEVAAQ